MRFGYPFITCDCKKDARTSYFQSRESPKMLLRSFPSYEEVRKAKTKSIINLTLTALHCKQH